MFNLELGRLFRLALAVVTGSLAIGTIGAASALAEDLAIGTSTSVEPPRLIFAPQLSYPERALEQRIAGEVNLELEISVTGTVTKAVAINGPSDDLNRAALEAVHSFVFEPARYAGEPVASAVRYHYHFRLPDEPQTHANHPEPHVPHDAEHGHVHEHEHPHEHTHAAKTSSAAADYEVYVREKRPPRSATDWVFDVGFESTSVVAGGSGAELLRRAPGLYITQHSGDGKAHQIFLRGFDAEHGQDVAISVGGIQINEPSNIHGQGYADLHFMIPEVVKSMHVLEGAYDPRQGDFAVAGSIDFNLGLTRRGLLARFSGGNYGIGRGMVAWGPEGEPDETFVAAEFFTTDGFGPSRAANRSSAMAQAMLDIRSNTKLRLLATTYAGRFDSAGVIRLDDFEAGKIGRFDTYDTQQGGTSMRHQALAEVLWEKDDTRAAVSMWTVLREFTLRQNFTGFLLYEEGGRSEQINDFVEFGGQANFGKKELVSGLSLEGGVWFRHNAIEQRQRRLGAIDNRPFFAEVDADVAITDIGVWGDAHLDFTDSFSLRTGVRADALSYRVEDHRLGLTERERLDGAVRSLGGERESSGFHVGPKATLDLRATDELRLFLSYGNGFRTPPAASLGQGERRPFTTVHSGELGARQRFSSQLEITAAAFATHVPKDLAFDHATGRSLFSGATTRSGGALLVTSKPLDWLHATGSVTYTYAINHDTNTRVPYAPTLVARADFDAQKTIAVVFDRELALFADIAFNVLGPRPLPFDEEGQPLFLVDTGAGIALDKHSLAIEVANLFDSAWRDAEFVYASDFTNDNATSRVPARHFTAGRPFTIQATLTLGF